MTPYFCNLAAGAAICMGLGLAWLAWSSGQRIVYALSASLLPIVIQPAYTMQTQWRSYDGVEFNALLGVNFGAGLAASIMALFWYLQMRSERHGTGSPRILALAAIALPPLSLPVVGISILLYDGGLARTAFAIPAAIPQLLGTALLAGSISLFRHKRRRVDKPNPALRWAMHALYASCLPYFFVMSGLVPDSVSLIMQILCLMAAATLFAHMVLTGKNSEGAVTANRSLRLTTQNLEQENRQLSETASRLEYERKQLAQRRLELEKENAQAEKRIRELCETADAFFTLGQSIDYARRIQQALLPSEAQLSACVGESWVLNLPRDKVSGDFLWCHRFEDGWAMVCVADCTGHGVPGAFMSALGSTLLGHVVTERGIRRPDQVLFALDRNLRSALSSSGGDIQDGMEAAVLLISPQRNQALFSGAKLKLHRALKGKCDTIEGTRRAIGGRLRDKAPAFESSTISLRRDEILYLASDGFQDQLGGPDRRRYLSGRFRDTLGWISGLPMKEQRSALQKSHTQWKAGLEQTDDVLVIAIKV